MKFTYLIFLLFLSSQSFSQSDTIFPNNGADWRVRAWQFDDLTWDPIPMPWLYYNVHIDTDAIPEGGKIWNTVREEEFGDTKGRIAIDSGKVYFQSYDDDYPLEGTGTEVMVLYDFNLDVGDTAYYTEEQAVVMEISSTFELGEERTTFILENGDEWVYGLGSNQGLFRPLHSVFEYAFTLCEFNGSYLDSEDASYTLALEDGAGCHLSIDETESPLIFRNVNPVYDNLLIDNISTQRQNYNLVNLNGQQVLHGSLHPGSNIVNIEMLATGTYIFQVQEFSQKVFIRN